MNYQDYYGGSGGHQKKKPNYPTHWGSPPKYTTGGGLQTWVAEQEAEDRAAGIGVTHKDPRWLYGWEPPAFTGDINADYASLTDDQRDEYGRWRGSDAYKPGWGHFIGHLRKQHMRGQGWKDPNYVPQIRAMGVPSNRTPGTPYNPGQVSRVARVHANRPSRMHQYRQQWKSPAPYNPTQAKRPSSNWY
jgi:hypothetical protein